MQNKSIPFTVWSSRWVRFHSLGLGRFEFGQLDFISRAKTERMEEHTTETLNESSDFTSLKRDCSNNFFFADFVSFVCAQEKKKKNLKFIFSFFSIRFLLFILRCLVDLVLIKFNTNYETKQKTKKTKRSNSISRRRNRRHRRPFVYLFSSLWISPLFRLFQFYFFSSFLIPNGRERWVNERRRKYIFFLTASRTFYLNPNTKNALRCGRHFSRTQICDGTIIFIR